MYRSIKSFSFDGLIFALQIAMLKNYVSPVLDETQFDLSRASLMFVLFIFVGGWSSWYLQKKQVFTLGSLLFKPMRKKSLPPFIRSLFGWQILFLFALALLAGSRQTQFSLFELFDSDGFESAKRLLFDLVRPDLTLLSVAVFKVIETIYIALIATLLAVPLAFMLAFFSAKNLMTHPLAFLVYALLRTLFNLLRSIEPVIWAIIFAVWVGVGPFAGMLALMIQSAASLTKQYSELIESAAEGPIESIKATGANPIQTIWYGIVPQVLLPYLSFTIYRWDTNVRMATIIGFAGGGGIGTILYQYSMRAQWPQVSCLILVIALVVWVLDIASAQIREALK